MRNLLVVAHAPSPNTEKMALATLEGAEQGADGAVKPSWIPPLQATAEDALAADAIILGTTENLGYMSGALKDFFDRVYYPCLEVKQGLPYVLYIRAGLDGTGTRRGVETIITGLRWRAVQEPLLCRGEFDPRFIDQCRELGMAMSAGLEAGIF